VINEIWNKDRYLGVLRPASALSVVDVCITW